MYCILQELAAYERISDYVKVTAERKYMSILCILGHFIFP